VSLRYNEQGLLANSARYMLAREDDSWVCRGSSFALIVIALSLTKSSGKCSKNVYKKEAVVNSMARN
jgi:hypothetical protein